MKIFADLHIHSKYSRATSKDMNLENLDTHSKVKGLNLLGTGDFTHPEWLKELKARLAEIDKTGMYNYKDKSMFYMLTSEISLIYTHDGKGRRIHNILLAPNFEIVDQIVEWLKTKGRIDYDGRPIFGFTCPELVEKMMQISKDIMVIPAHAWTPWFSLFGSNSGFDTIKDCFQDQTKNIFAIETGLSCYDTETEVLTSDGWKKIYDINDSDYICTLNIEKNEVEFQKTPKFFKYAYKGKMYRLKTKRIDLLVTPNHKLLYSSCDFRKPPVFKLKEAELLFGKSKRFKKDGIWIGKNPEYFVLPQVQIKHGSKYYSGFRNKKEKRFPIKEWLKFFGFWIAEGWTTMGGNGDYNVCIANNDRNLLTEMKHILESFGYGVYHCDKKAGIIRVRDYQLFNYLKQFGKCPDKFIPSDIKSFSKELLEIFFDYYIKGDGHIYGRARKGLSATTISKHLRDDLQEIALKMGISAYYKLHKKKGTPITSLPHAKLKCYKQSEDSWVIYFIRKNIHSVIPSSIKKYKRTEAWVDYDNFVYCLEVPNHVIYIRRNGIPVWCGNSDPEMNWRLSQLDNIALISNSDSHSFHSWRLGREANVFELEKVSYKEITNTIKDRDKKKFLYTIEVDPAYGKYHFDGHRVCDVSFSPQESAEHNNICPKCKKHLTIGVEHRVEELADRPLGVIPKSAIPFKRLLPLAELLSSVYGCQLLTKKVLNTTELLTNEFGSELNVLLEATAEKLSKTAGERIANIILLNRQGLIKVIPGYDGVYGKPVLDEEKAEKKKQKSLSDF